MSSCLGSGKIVGFLPLNTPTIEGVVLLSLSIAVKNKIVIVAKSALKNGSAIIPKPFSK